MTNQGSLKISGDAMPRLQLIAKNIGAKATLAVAGRAGANCLRAHFRELNATKPNKLGGRRQNFWSAIGRSVFVQPASDTSVAVSIGHDAIGQKVNGGEIRAKRTKYLTIPLIREAYGKTAQTYEVAAITKQVKSKKASVNARGQWNAQLLKSTGRAGHLFPVRLKSGKLVLAEQAADGIRPVFLLVKRVNQAADPNALPSEQYFTSYVMRELESFANSILDQ